MRGNKLFVGFLIMLPLLVGAGCSTGSLSSGPKDCGSDLVCFQNQFKTCSPATMANSQGDTSGSVTINGSKNNRCEVSIRVISGKDSSPVVTTCLFDPAKKYEENMLSLGTPSWFKQYCTQTK